VNTSNEAFVNLLVSACIGYKEYKFIEYR
jgi:hypothetical protein